MKIREKITFLPHISQVVLGICSGIIIGIGIRLWTGAVFDYLAFVGFIISVVILLFFYRNWQSWIIAILICGLIYGFSHTDRVMRYSDNSREGTELNTQFEIVSQPTTSGRFLKTYGTSQEYGKVLLNFATHSDIVRGSIARVKCKLKSPEKFNDFDYPKYLLMHRVNYICNVKSYELVGYNDNFLNKIASVRRKLEGNISKMMPAPESGLANGLIFGGDDRLSEELQNSFAITGMTHIVAVSGYNVSVIVFAVIAVGIFVGFYRKQAALISVVVVIIFVAMIGFPSSGVRAAIMGTIVLFAVVFGRASNSLNLVVLSSTAMLLWSPLQLRYDVGFQLSFLAVIGILTIYPIFEKLIVVKYRAFALTEILFITISAQLFVLPIIIINFHIFSLSSVLTNLLVLPILPLTMFFVFLASIFSLVSFSIAYVFIWLAYFLLSYEIFIIEFFANQTWSNVIVENFPVSLSVLYYLALSAVIYYFKKRMEV